jgi:formimidoylglutamate deiminase
MGAPVNALFARRALLPEGWRRDVLLEWDAQGDLAAVTPDAAAPAGAGQAGYVMPGMVNLHSHAFQRAMGGLTETAGQGPDSFWTWRELMYRFASRITPGADRGDRRPAVCRMPAPRLHRRVRIPLPAQRDPDGAPYAPPAETALRIAAAAAQTGIGLTMLPVLYSYAGFGERAFDTRAEALPQRPRPGAGHRRGSGALRGGQLEAGAAPHSLRAASIGQIRELAEGAAGRASAAHPHRRAAGRSGAMPGRDRARPVEYLMDRAGSMRAGAWCMRPTWRRRDGALAASGAVAGLCPTTEANLGDGLFPLALYRKRAALRHRQRQPCVAESRWKSCAGSNTASACCTSAAISRPGMSSATSAPSCGARRCRAAPRPPDAASAAWPAACAPTCWCSTRPSEPRRRGGTRSARTFPVLRQRQPGARRARGGRWVVRGGRHRDQDGIAQRYIAAVRELRSA